MTTVTHQPHKVFVAQHWEDDWTEMEGLFCDQCTFAAAPTVNTAQLSRLFGYVERAGSEGLFFEGPLSIDDWYVKVEIEQGEGTGAKKWIGVVVQSSKGRHGMPSDTAQPGGVQIFECRGLEFLFQRTIIDRSWVRTQSGDEKEIQRAIAFNLGSGDATARWREPNRAEEYGTAGVPIFDVRSGEDVIPWSGTDAVNYLLKYYPPQNALGDGVVDFTLDPGFSSTVLQALEPALPTHGKTLWQVLNELIDRRRLMSWIIEPDEDDNPVIKVFTFNKSQVDLPDNSTIHANANQKTFYFDSDDRVVGTARLISDSATRYDVVVARGERLGACFTVSNQTGTLDKDWTATLQTDYENGATGAAGYNVLLPIWQQNWNYNARRRDNLQKVYRYFRLSLDWNGTVSSTVVCPNPGHPSESAAFWTPGLRFKPLLPLLSELDYQTSSTSPTVGTLADSKAEYRRPFAVVYHSDKSRYYFLDKLGAQSGPDLSPETNGCTFSVSCRMHDDHCALILDVSGSDQHMIAKNDFTAAEGSSMAGKKVGGAADPVFDWKQIYVTVFCEFDQYAEQQWPTQVTSSEQLRRLIVDVPHARLDNLAKDTIIGLDSAGQPILAAGGYVRDDRSKLLNIARSSYEWYGQTRQALELVQKDLRLAGLDIGVLLTTIGSANDPQTVNTVITHLAFDLLAGTLSLKTQFAELDVKERFV